MNCKLTIAFMALSFCAAAQTSTNVPSVTLSGPVNDPTITNHSGKALIAAMVVFTSADKMPRIHNRLFTHDTLGLLDGGSERLTNDFVNNNKLKSPIVAVTVKAAIFADGEFRGDDNYQDMAGKTLPGNFQTHIESEMQAMRRVLQMAKTGKWDAVRTEADGKGGDGEIFASRLLFEHDRLGADKAVNKMAHWGLLPASTWKGTPLVNHLKKFVPEDLLAWFVPLIAQAQSVSYNFVTNWPQSDMTDAWHATKWIYTCYDFNNSTYPCPGQRNTTNEEGIAAVCNATPTYDIGNSETLTQDYGGSVGAHMVINNGEVQPGGPTWTLKNWGVCDVAILGFYESYRYLKSCTGSSDPAPIKDYDTTGSNVCGTSSLGYHS